MDPITTPPRPWESGGTTFAAAARWTPAQPGDTPGQLNPGEADPPPPIDAGGGNGGVMSPWVADDGGRICGTRLGGDLAAILSLEDDAMHARRALIAMSAHLQTATMVGGPAPVVHLMSERLRRPQLGDLVVETTTLLWGMRRHESDWYRGIGVLLAHRREWDEDDTQWAQMLADDPALADQRISGEAWYIQYGPSPEDVCHWGNSDFLAVPWRHEARSDWAR